MDELKKKKIKSIKNIKSPYIIKKIFSFLKEKQKLNMIIYNKCLQKKFCVNVEYYKKISGKYKIGEKNGIGKECNLYTNKVIFEGEYLNGKRHGKGKAYYNDGKTKFEGEYLNGKRHGKGKEYYDNSNLRFEGEYLKGQKWNGKVYDYEGNSEYELKMELVQ